MKQIWMKIQTRVGRVTGHTLTEYAVILAFISIAAVVVLIKIGQSTTALLQQTNSNMP